MDVQVNPKKTVIYRYVSDALHVNGNKSHPMSVHVLKIVFSDANRQ